MRRISDRWFYIPIFLLGLHLLYRLIDQSKLMWIFPLDWTNDISSYMAILYFLIKCGFHNYCGYWYNGFVSFLIHAPGWYFFAFPLYFLFKNIQIVTYVSIILMYFIGFIFLYFFGRNYGFSLVRVIAFFVLFFGNAITVGNFIRLGRVVSMFPFVILIGLMIVIFKYKDKEIDRGFFWFIPLYGLLLISHYQEAVIFHFLLLGLFFVKNNRERLVIVLCILLGLILSAFWWVPFLREVFRVSMLGITQANWLLALKGQWFLTNVAAFFIPLAFFVSFYFYLISESRLRKEFLFFLPILVVVILVFLKLIVFIPILRNISPDPYLTFFMFFVIFFVLKSKFNLKMRRIIGFIIIFLCVLSVFISVVHTPFFIKHSKVAEEVISLFPLMEGRFIILKNLYNEVAFTPALYDYANIYYDIFSAGGHSQQIVGEDYLNLLFDLGEQLVEGNCKSFLDLLNKLNTTEIISYGGYCESLSLCGLEKKVIGEYSCLYVKM